MPRPKRGSAILEKAQQRAAAMKSIDSDLNLGNGLTIQAFLASIQDVQSKLDAYNTLLSTLDQMTLALKVGEQSLSELSERMLTGVASKYGRYSNEYVMAGGSPRSTRRRSGVGRELPAEMAAVGVTIMPSATHGVNGSVNGVVVK